MNNVGIYSPWVIFCKKVTELFKQDPDVRVEVSDDNQSIKLYVDKTEKADALSKILPSSKSFGNVSVSISVIPSNEGDYKAKYFKTAFDGNGAFSHLTTVDHIPDMYISNPISYCVFKKEVVQYGADDLSSESGVRSTLYQDIASDIFGDVEGVFFCTDVN